jgi:predicted metalloprotease with PDZ domain
LQRTGRARPEDFAASWNEVLLAYATSPARAAPSRRIEEEYWTDPDVGKLPYQRGRLLAALWDHKLRRATGDARDLDDVILAMYRSARAARDRDALPPAADRFAAAYREQGGPPIEDDLDRYVVRGEPIELPAEVFGGCARLKTTERRAFDRGWDAAATARNHNVITGLRRDSPAYRAGLRDGMTVIRRLSGVPGDVTVPYSLRVLDGNRERTITFWPRGAGTVTAQQLELTMAATLASRAACAALLGGDR